MNRKAWIAAAAAALLAAGGCGVITGSSSDDGGDPYPGDGTVLADDLVEARHLALAGGAVYFTDDASGLVARVPAAGGAVETLEASAESPGPIATDGVAVYWLEDAHGKVGGAVRRLALGGGPGDIATIAVGVSDANAIAVDPGAGGSVFWVEGNGGPLRVRRCAKDGSGASVVTETAAYIGGVATDGASVYAVDPGVARIDPASGTATALSLPATGEPSALALAGDRLLWIELEDRAPAELRAAPTDGSGPTTTLAAGAEEVATLSYDALATDADFAYFFAGGEVASDGSATPVLLKRVALAGGGAPSTVARLPDDALPGAIAVDGGHVYWAEGTAVRRIAK